MTYTPLQPAQVEREIRRLSREGDVALDAMAVLAEQVAEAERAWKVGRAKALLTSNAGSQDRREAAALVACEAQYASFLAAMAALEAAREAARWRRSRLDALRSISASVRASLEAS